MNPLFVLSLQSFPPSIVSCLLHLFYLGKEGLRLRWRQHWLGGGSGRDGGGGSRDEEGRTGGERVTCWTTFLCSCGSWCRVGAGGQSRIIIALQGIMNGLLFGGLLCPHLFAQLQPD